MRTAIVGVGSLLSLPSRGGDYRLTGKGCEQCCRKPWDLLCRKCGSQPQTHPERQKSPLQVLHCCSVVEEGIRPCKLECCLLNYSVCTPTHRGYAEPCASTEKPLGARLPPPHHLRSLSGETCASCLHSRRPTPLPLRVRDRGGPFH